MLKQNYVGGRYCHQTSTLFTIVTKQIHHRQTTKKLKARQKRTIIYMEICRREESRKIKIIYTEEHKYKKNIHNNNKLRNLYTGSNICPTQTHMIAEPFDSLVRTK